MLSRFGGCMLVAALMVAGAGAGQDGAGEEGNDMAALIAAEWAFAQASEALGTRRAFLDFLADGAVLFRPLPVEGRRWYQERPDIPGALSWGPASATLAAAGDLGLSTGPWTFESGREGAPPFHGQFISLWRRQTDGGWKVELDVGVGHPPPAKGGAPPEKVAADRLAGPAEVDRVAARSSLARAEAQLAAAAEARGYAAALRERAAADLRLYRQGREPVTGAEAAAKAATEVATREGSPTDPLVVGLGISRSGDLGYAYGLATLTLPGGGDAQTATFLRVWKRPGASGDWQLALDYTVPVPPSS